jgi:hypothetical protein
MAKPSKRWIPQTDEYMKKLFPRWKGRDICQARGKHEDRGTVDLVTKDNPRVCSGLRDKVLLRDAAG